MGQEEGPESFVLPSLAAWQQAVGTVFSVREPEPLALTLEQLATFERAAGWESFSLRFSGPPGLPQGTHLLEHEDLGTFHVFLVPVATLSQRRQYEAVVNRPVPSTP